MKEVFKCDYCNYIGTKEEVEEHEKVCLNNPDVKCCYNCQYAWQSPRLISAGFGDSTPLYICMYRPYTKYDPCVLYTGGPYQKRIFASIIEEGNLAGQFLYNKRVVLSSGG